MLRLACLLVLSARPLAALELDAARAALGRVSATEPPLPGAPVEADLWGWRSLVFEYRVEAPVEDVWRLYTTTPLDKLLPDGRLRPTMHSRRAVCPGGRGDYPTSQVWPALLPGLEIQGVLDWGPAHLLEDMDVVELEPLRRLKFRYAERSPAEGDQTIELFPDASGVRIVHSTHYRGKNPLNSALYGYVHKTLLDSWHLGSKYYLETRLWAGRWCEAAPAPDAAFDALFADAQGESSAALRPAAFRRALCLYSRRFFGPASDVPRTEDRLARWLADLAMGLDADEYAALMAYRRGYEADEAALAAGASACR